MSDQPPPLPRLARQIFVFTTLVTKLAGQDREQRLAAQLPGLSGLGYGVMQILRAGPQTLSDLAGKMLLAPATLVPVVQRLEQDGLIARGQDAEDRRRKPLSLTARGRETLAAAAPHDEPDLLARGLQALGEPKARQLDGLLRELLGHLAPQEDFVAQVEESLDRLHTPRKE